MVVWLLASDALGQFASTISVPPNPAPSAIGSNTRLNLESGGELPAIFQAGLPDGTGTNVEVNINGGLVGGGFRANGGSVVNIIGGTFANGFDSGLRETLGSVVNIAGGKLTGIAANSGSSTRISGGVYTGTISANNGSAIRVLGDDFRLDGVPIAGLEDVGDSHIQSVPTGQVLTGILSDGTPFFLSNLKADSISSNTLILEQSSVPPAGPSLIQVPFDSAPLGIRADQTLVVAAGGNVDSSFRAGWGSSLRVEGGNLGRGLAGGRHSRGDDRRFDRHQRNSLPIPKSRSPVARSATPQTSTKAPRSAFLVDGLGWHCKSRREALWKFLAEQDSRDSVHLQQAA